jgi:hypothetical protein
MVGRTIRIATVYQRGRLERLDPYAMDTVRWVRVSEWLADLGFQVDLIVDTNERPHQVRPNLRYVPFAKVEWGQYDVIKTLFHKGYETLVKEGMEAHPFVISKLGSVVGKSDDIEGVHFFDGERSKLYGIQKRLHEHSRYVTILTEASKGVWQAEFGLKNTILLVPTGVDRMIPPRSGNPYAEFRERIAVYIGNIYRSVQKDVNVRWQARLNDLGRLLRKRGIRLCFVGIGDVKQLDPNVVTCLGPVRNDRIWDYQYFADVGIALAQGKVQHNESSKLYYYLRTGLPVVSEDPVPNNHVIRESHLGFISDYGDNQMMTDMIEAAVVAKWDREDAIRYILNNHTWDKRVGIYERVIREELDPTGRSVQGA